MFQNLDVFRMSSAMAAHAGQRQAIVAQNVANANTPGYVSRDIPDFRMLMSPDSASQQRATREAHIHGGARDLGRTAPLELTRGGSPNGNQVTLEDEMLRSVDAKRQHDRALAIYKHAMTVLRSAGRTR